MFGFGLSPVPESQFLVGLGPLKLPFLFDLSFHCCADINVLVYFFLEDVEKAMEK
jgi:hypothetical protein